MVNFLSLFWRYFLKSSIAKLERKMVAIKQQIAAIGDIRPGSISVQFNVCGNPKCRCKEDPPQKHGPYYKLTFKRKGKSGCRFIKEDDLAVIEEQLKNYKLLRALVDEWIEFGSKLADLRVERQSERKQSRHKVVPSD